MNADTEMFSDVLRENDVYRTSLEYLNRGESNDVPVTDIEFYWTRHFKDSVSSNSSNLKGQVTCFMNLVSASGIGEYKVGRRGGVSRLEIQREKLEAFISPTGGIVADSEIKTDTDQVQEPQEAHQQDEKREEEKREEELPEDLNSGFSPELNINVQIHISADAKNAQIEKIFESMATHLFNRKAGKRQ